MGSQEVDELDPRLENPWIVQALTESRQPIGYIVANETSQQSDQSEALYLLTSSTLPQKEGPVGGTVFPSLPTAQSLLKA